MSHTLSYTRNFVAVNKKPILIAAAFATAVVVAAKVSSVRSVAVTVDSAS